MWCYWYDYLLRSCLNHVHIHKKSIFDRQFLPTGSTCCKSRLFLFIYHWKYSRKCIVTALNIDWGVLFLTVIQSWSRNFSAPQIQVSRVCCVPILLLLWNFFPLWKWLYDLSHDDLVTEILCLMRWIEHQILQNKETRS